MSTAKTEAIETSSSNTLDGFGFDNEETFFGQKPVEQDGNLLINEVKTKTAEGTKTTELKEVKTKGEENEEEEEESPTFFNETDEKKKPGKKKEEEDGVDDKGEETKVKNKEETTGEEQDDSKFFHQLALELKEKGTFQNVEIKEDSEITEDEFFKLQEQEVDARVNEVFEGFFGELDEDGKKFLKFKKEGGKTTDFLNQIATNLEIEDFDVSDDIQRDRVITYYLMNVEGLEGEDLKERVTWLKEGGKEKASAERYFKSIKKREADELEALVNSQTEASKARAKNTETFNNNLSETINTTEQVGAFKLTKQEQKELGVYFTKPVIKVGKNRYIPQFQADLAKTLRGETPEDRKSLILLGKMVKSNYDVSDAVAEKATKVVKESKSKLQEAKNNPKARTSNPGVKTSNTSISDYF